MGNNMTQILTVALIKQRNATREGISVVAAVTQWKSIQCRFPRWLCHCIKSKYASCLWIFESVRPGLRAPHDLKPGPPDVWWIIYLSLPRGRCLMVDLFASCLLYRTWLFCVKICVWEINIKPFYIHYKSIIWCSRSKSNQNQFYGVLKSLSTKLRG